MGLYGSAMVAGHARFRHRNACTSRFARRADWFDFRAAASLARRFGDTIFVRVNAKFAKPFKLVEAFKILARK